MLALLLNLPFVRVSKELSRFLVIVSFHFHKALPCLTYSVLTFISCCSIFKDHCSAALASDLTIISHCRHFVKRFLKSFLKSFFRGYPLCDSLYSISYAFAFVKGFLKKSLNFFRSIFRRFFTVTSQARCTLMPCLFQLLKTAADLFFDCRSLMLLLHIVD